MSEMNRREFVEAGLALGLVPGVSGVISPFVQAQSAQGATLGSDSTPAWMLERPIVMAGCWDDFPLFQVRMGGGPVQGWLDELYQRQGDPATAASLKSAGVTLAVIPFFKGFGLEAEHEQTKRARSLAHLLRQNGIRVGLYVGSTIFYETFLLEQPDAEAWFVPDFLGKPMVYGDQTFRRRVYFMHPGYRAYIKKVIKYGIEQIQADLIHFDNTSLQARPGIFQHPLAIEDFRKHLGSKYTASERKGRLGFSDLRYVVPPKVENAPARINDPLFQEFAEFRCHQLVSYYAEMRAYIRSLNREVASDNNPSSGLSVRDLIWEQGVDYPQLIHEVDAVWTEEGAEAGVMPDGTLVSKIRTFKAAGKLKRTVFCYTWGTTGNWGYSKTRGTLLDMAESMAYNRQSLGMVGIVEAIKKMPPEPRQYIRFLHENFHLYRDVEAVADVALLYSFASMGFNQGRPNMSFMLASQALIQGRFPFDIIFDQQLDDLSRYRVLFLADQESLSDHQIERIREFVKHGGGLVATAHSSLYNERRQRRPDFGLSDCFGVSAPQWRGSDVEEALVSGGPKKTKVGMGQVAYVPEIARPLPSGSSKAGRADAENQGLWGLPANHHELWDAVETALQGTATISIPRSVSPFVTIELVRQSAGQSTAQSSSQSQRQLSEERLVLHLLNYDYKRTLEVKDIPVSITVPEGKSVRQIEVLSPDRPGAHEHISWTGAATISFTIPLLRIYTVVVMDLA